MNRFKRLIALLLCIATMLSLMGNGVPTAVGEAGSTEAVAVEAVEVTPTPEVTASVEEAAAVEASCDYCTVTVAEDGTLTHEETCVAEYVYDGTADVGKYVKLVESESMIMVSDESKLNETAEDFFYYEDFTEDTIFRITDWFWNEETTGIWYEVEFYSGEIVEEYRDLWPEIPYILQNYTHPEYAGDNALEFVTIEEPEDSCDICGEAGCTKEHVRCDVCGNYDCVLSHVYCHICGTMDCTAKHVFCTTCGKYDCGVEHADIYTPATAPVIPDSVVLPEGEEHAVADEDGNVVVGSFELTAGRKSSLSAWSKFDGDETGTDVSYKWQVRYDGFNDLWTDIRGQQGKGILMSPAMFLPLMEDGITPAIRSVVKANGETLTGDPIEITVSGTTATSSYTAPVAMDLADEETERDVKDKINLIVGYHFSKDNSIAANSWAAELVAGEAFSQTITVPAIPGFVPTFANTDYAVLSETNGVYTLAINYGADTLNADTTLNIAYQPGYVNVTVNHHWQNETNDNYTLFETETLSLLTDSIVGNVNKIGTTPTAEKPGVYDADYEGVYPLLYEHPTVAADGSTVVNIYYDRYYYLISFDLGGGYGVEPTYDRYGAPVHAVSVPTRPGYVFAGWNETIPATMPHENKEFTALWTAADTSYRVSYWTLNDDNTKTLLGSHVEYGTSNATVNGTDNLGTEYGTICGEELSHVHSDDCFSCGAVAHNHTSDCLTGYTLTSNIPGSGGNAIQDMGAESGYIYVVYSYTYSRYWPKLYLNGQYFVVNGVEGGYDEESFSSIVEGPVLGTYTGTYSGETLTVTKYQAKTVCGNGQHTHTSCTQTCTEHTHTDDCYQDTKYLEFASADQNVVIKGDGTSVVNVYYRYKQYTLRFYYAASQGTGNNIVYKIVGGTSYYFGSWGSNTSNDETLLENHYWNYSGQWGTVDELPQLNDRGNARNYIKGSETFKYNGTDVTYYYISFTARYGDNIADKWPCAVFNSVTRKTTNSHGNWSGTEAFVSAWNGEHHVKYSQENENQTIKGVYEKLDENLLFHPNYTDEETVSFLCFWENGANIDWSVPELYRYKIYLSAYSGMDLTDKTTITRDGKTYYLKESYDTCDDSDVDHQTQSALVGYNPVTFNTERTGYQVSDSRKFEYRKLTGTTNATNLQKDNYYDSSLYKEGYEINFYYDAKTYKLSFWNHDDYLTDGTGSMVAYHEPLEKYFEGVGNYEGASDLVVKPDYYPSSLEPGAYEFAGWYSSANFEPETRIDPATAVMQDEALMVYARWVPILRNVCFYMDKDDMEAGTTIPEVLTREPYTTEFAARDVSHGFKLGNVGVPGVAENDELEHPYRGYEFVGWFYMNDGVEKAFDPANMPVTDDLQLYAKWNSNVLCNYAIYYVLDENKNGIRDTGENTYVAEPTTGSALEGNTKTFEAKGDTDLYEQYRAGYFPTIQSHSFDVQIDEVANTHTFLYQKVDSVPYTVKYLIAGTTEPVPGLSPKTVTTDKAIVTENFVPKQGYMPDAYQKTLIVVPGALNEIVFYYTADTVHAYYRVNHYIQNLDGTTWSEYRSSEVTGEIGKVYDENLAKALTITGFTFSADETNGFNSQRTVDGVSYPNGYNPYTKQGLPTAVNAVNSNHAVTGTLSAAGMELNLYYTRNSYPYVVYYKDYHTGDDILDAEGNAMTENGTAYYGLLFTKSAPQIVASGVNGEEFELYAPNESSKAITIQEDMTPVEKNVITFYYTRCEQDISVTKTVTNGSAAYPAPEGMSFNFKITIQPPFEFHANNYQFTTSRGESGILYPENGTMTFTLAAGETITIDNLPTANYTVEEVMSDLPVGYYPNMNGTNTASTNVTLTKNNDLELTCTNTYDPANLTIRKEVYEVQSATNVTPLDKFEFTITFPAGVTPEASYDYTVSGTEGTKTAAVSAGRTMTIELEDGQTATFLNLPLGQYTVTETDYTAQSYNSYSRLERTDWTNATVWTEGEVCEPELVRGETTSAEYANLFPVGDLEISKTVSKEFYKDPWNGGTFTFTVDRWNEVDGSNTETALVNGNTYSLYLDGSTQPTGSATVVNNQLVVAIKFTGSTDDTEDPAFKTDAEKLMIDGEKITHELLIKNLPAGIYRVVENEDTAYTQTPVDRTVSEIQVPKPVDADTAATATAEFTNVLKRFYGSMEITKDVSLIGDGVENPDPNKSKLFDITVNLIGDRNFNGTVNVAYSAPVEGDTRPVTVQAVNGSFTIRLKEDETATITQVPAVGFTVTEANYEDYDEVISLTEGVKVNDVWTIDPTATAKVLVTNEYPVKLGTLTIVKTISGDVPDGELQSFLFHIKGTNNDVDMDVVINGAGQITISEMPLGTYTVTEDTAWSWRYDCAEPVKTATIAVNEVNQTVTFQNTYTESKWLTELVTIVNKFTQSSQTTPAE